MYHQGEKETGALFIDSPPNERTRRVPFNIRPSRDYESVSTPLFTRSASPPTVKIKRIARPFEPRGLGRETRKEKKLQAPYKTSRHAVGNLWSFRRPFVALHLVPRNSLSVPNKVVVVVVVVYGVERQSTTTQEHDFSSPGSRTTERLIPVRSVNVQFPVFGVRSRRPARRAKFTRR